MYEKVKKTNSGCISFYRIRDMIHAILHSYSLDWNKQNERVETINRCIYYSVSLKNTIVTHDENMYTKMTLFLLMNHEKYFASHLLTLGGMFAILWDDQVTIVKADTVHRYRRKNTLLIEYFVRITKRSNSVYLRLFKKKSIYPMYTLYCVHNELIFLFKEYVT